MEFEWNERTLWAKCHVDEMKGLALAQFGGNPDEDHISAEVILACGKHLHPKPRYFTSFAKAKTWIEQTIIKHLQNEKLIPTTVEEHELLSTVNLRNH